MMEKKSFYGLSFAFLQTNRTIQRQTRLARIQTEIVNLCHFCCPKVSVIFVVFYNFVIFVIFVNFVIFVVLQTRFSCTVNMRLPVLRVRAYGEQPNGKDED